MSSCKEIKLSVLGESYQVVSLIGQESLFKIWYLDLTIYLPLNWDVRRWLYHSAECHLLTEDADERIFSGEIISVKSEGFFLSEKQVVQLRLCSYLHRFEKSGGAKFFKQCCFRDIVSQLLIKHHLIDRLEVIFSADLGTEKLEYTQQFSEENDTEFIDRLCYRSGWVWLLQASPQGPDKLYFFKKSEKFLSDSISLNFYRCIEKNEDNMVTWEINSLSQWIALGHRCAPIKDAMVVSIKHHFGIFSELMEVKQYYNQLGLATSLGYSALILNRFMQSSSFQLGLVKSNLPYAEIDDAGDYAVEILSEAIAPVRETYAIRALLGYGGALSHFSGFSTGVQSLWYNNTEILLAEVDKCENSLKILGSLSNSSTVNPVVRHNKTSYQWRTIKKMALSFEDGPDNPRIAWTTEGIKNSLMMGDMIDGKQGIVLKALFGVLHVSGDKGIDLVSAKKVKEQVRYSRDLVIENKAHLKNEHNKIHYEASRKSIFDFKKSMILKSTELHWKVQNKSFWSGKSIDLSAGALFCIKILSGNFSAKAGKINIVGKGELVLSNHAGTSGIYISPSGKITVKGSTIYTNGITTIKGNVNSHIVRSNITPAPDYGLELELREPGDLPRVTRNQEALNNLSNELFDPFDQIIEGEYEESGWINLAVDFNERYEKLNRMKIKKELSSHESISNFVLSKR